MHVCVCIINKYIFTNICYVFVYICTQIIIIKCKMYLNPYLDLKHSYLGTKRVGYFWVGGFMENFSLNDVLGSQLNDIIYLFVRMVLFVLTKHPY